MKSKLKNSELILHLKALGLITAFGMPISYTGFKNRATVHRYSDGSKLVLLGLPRENMFGFYVDFESDSEMVRNAYSKFKKLVDFDMTDYNAGVIQWGNCGIPLAYKNLTSK